MNNSTHALVSFSHATHLTTMMRSFGFSHFSLRLKKIIAMKSDNKTVFMIDQLQKIDWIS